MINTLGRLHHSFNSSSSKVVFLLTLELCLALSSRSFSQLAKQDSIRVLASVEVTDTRLEYFGSGDKISTILPQAIGYTKPNNLAQLLMRYSAVNVRSYGISGLSTASLRGSGSNHTPIFWEGINLQSSMNGSLDLTLMPAFFLDKVSLQHGNAGALYGAGTLGGAIHLGSDTRLQPGTSGKLFQQFGSFGDRQLGIQLQYGDQAGLLRIRAFDRKADNDFPYYNIYRNREERRQHAGLSQRGILTEFYRKLSSHQRISVKYWLQDNEVEIPGVAAAGGATQALQSDLFHRMVLDWELVQPKYKVEARTAILGHQLVYDDNIREESTSEATSWITELQGTFYLREGQWFLGGINHTYEQAEVFNYGANSPRRNRTALFLSYNTQLYERLNASVSLRETLIDSDWSPVLPSLSLAYSIDPNWRLRAKVGRSYNLPTFNDLFWLGASQGNTNLLPEEGWGTEIGLDVSNSSQSSWKLQGSFTVFSNWMDDWIQWIPTENSQWSPRNVQQVWARGLEATIEAQHTFTQDLSIQFWGLYSYTRSTKEKISGGGNPADLHKQLIYTPYHQGKASAQFSFQNWELGLASNFIGEQFTDESNRQALSAYMITDLSLGYEWQIHKSHQLSAYGALNNIFDHAYEVRQGYPMPGRNYQLSLIYQFN